MKEKAHREHYIDFKLRKMHVANTANANMKLYIQNRTSFLYLMYICQVIFSAQLYAAYLCYFLTPELTLN